MVRLLVVTTVPQTLRAFLLPFARHFRSKGWQVDAVAAGLPDAGSWTAEFNRVWDIGWSRTPYSIRNISAAKAVQGIVANLRYDLVHVHTPVAAFVTRAALSRQRRQLGCKVIYTAHGFHFHSGGEFLTNQVYLGAEKLAGRWTDQLVVINEEDEMAALRNHIVPEDRLVRMAGVGVDCQTFSPESISPKQISECRRELGLEEDDALFLMVAEFNPGKRHRDAIRALHCLDNPRVHIAFAGVGPEMDQMKSLADELGVSHRTHFLGFRSDVAVLMRTAVATVLPSEREGLPRSLLESMSLSIPIIGADTRGIRDLARDGCGFLFPVGAAEALSDRMRWILEHPCESQQMGLRAREQAWTFDIRTVLSAHEQLYERAMTTTWNM